MYHRPIPPPDDSPYDRVPYGSEAVPLTAPEHLAITSLLAGGPRPRLDRFHLLEIGCAEGGNLLPLAVYHPEARFVGLDASSAQVAMARAAASAVGAGNVEFHHGDLRDPGALDGESPFDFIVAHGVYSWIPEDARAALLDLCARRLAPDGVAYVSYNTLPGWKLRGIARDIAWRAAGEATDPEQRCERARQAARSLRAMVSDDEDPWSRLIAVELAKLAAARSSYLTHEYLSPDNVALYLTDFVAAARAAGLDYISDAMNLRNDSPSMRRLYEQLEAQGLSPIEIEQAADLLHRRYFRASLLCRPGRRGASPDNASLTGELWAAASLGAPEGPPRWLPGEVERFRGVDGVDLGIGDPLCKAAFRVLSAMYPAALRVPELGARAVRLLEESGLEVDPPDPPLDVLAGDLRLLYGRGQVELRLREPRLRVAPGRRPRVTPLGRYQARTVEVDAAITTPLHDRLPLDPLERAIVLLLDGTRDAPAIVESIAARVAAGEIDAGVALDDTALLPSLLAKINGTVEHLAAWGLLVPD